MKTIPRRGDILWVALDPAVGTEIRKTRPAIVISNDSRNRFGARVVVLPITSNVTSLFPGEARISVRGKPARALGDQVRSIDTARLRGRLGTLSPAELHDVEEAIRVTLGLGRVAGRAGGRGGAGQHRVLHRPLGCVGGGGRRLASPAPPPARTVERSPASREPAVAESATRRREVPAGTATSRADR